MSSVARAATWLRAVKAPIWVLFRAAIPVGRQRHDLTAGERRDLAVVRAASLSLESAAMLGGGERRQGLRADRRDFIGRKGCNVVGDHGTDCSRSQGGNLGAGQGGDLVGRQRRRSDVLVSAAICVAFRAAIWSVESAATSSVARAATCFDVRAPIWVLFRAATYRRSSAPPI